MRTSVAVIILVFYCYVSGAQITLVDAAKQEFDELYGLNVLLYSGKKNLPYYLDHSGHPFWQNKVPFIGDVVIHGRKFTNQQINYNIERQEFILTYADYNGGVNQLILNSEGIDSVYTANLVFVRNQNEKIKQGFVQLVYSNNIKCYKTWQKDLQVAKNCTSRSGFQYAKERNELYLSALEKTLRFYSKKSFLHFFEKQDWGDIKKYISRNNIKFRNISDEELKNLLVYCENLNR